MTATFILAHPLYACVHEITNPLHPFSDIILTLPRFRLGMPLPRAQKVGVLCKYDGKYMIVEYSEVTDNVRTMQEIDEVEGVPRLLYDAGNICNHYFHMDFLHRVCQQYAETLTHHIAKKQIPAVDEHGNVTKVAGMKLELFIFDILKFAHEVQTYYANRDEEVGVLARGREWSYSHLTVDFCR